MPFAVGAVKFSTRSVSDAVPPVAVPTNLREVQVMGLPSSGVTRPPLSRSTDVLEPAAAGTTIGLGVMTGEPGGRTAVDPRRPVAVHATVIVPILATPETSPFTTTDNFVAPGR